MWYFLQIIDIYKNGSELYKRHIEEDIVNNYVSKKSIESNSKE